MGMDKYDTPYTVEDIKEKLIEIEGPTQRRDEDKITNSEYPLNQGLFKTLRI